MNGIYQPLLEVVRFCGRVTILLYGGYMVATPHTKEVGSVVAILSILGLVHEPDDHARRVLQPC